MTRITTLVAITATILTSSEITMADNIQLKLQSINKSAAKSDKPQKVVQEETWPASQTAIIVCDVWDYHHCLNAVRRMEEFVPRLDLVLKAARKSGAIIIHAPSDCMASYAGHPARERAIAAPVVRLLPKDIRSWCSRLEQEGRNYPIDQSDGGEDDDPKEHAAWAAKLTSLGRNPNMPWKNQSHLITIDSDRDYISDRGDEVWNILEQRGIRNVILTGVHCNMCVLGRPFGLRQMVRNKKHVVLMRDMTDSMYSPKSWPYVDHMTGHERVLDYVEEYICPTITSDQFLGGQPFRWSSNRRKIPQEKTLNLQPDDFDLTKRWIAINPQSEALQNALKDQTAPLWYRGAIMLLPKRQTMANTSIELTVLGKVQIWLNGHELRPTPASTPAPTKVRFTLPDRHILGNDYNLIVVKTVATSAKSWQADLFVGEHRLDIAPLWQVRLGDDPQYSNIPLPAKFGIGPDAVLTVPEHQIKW